MTEASHRAAVAERAARAGGVVARESFRQGVPVETKKNKNDLVTAADREAQSQVVATIRQEFPSDAFILEEDAQTLAGPETDSTPPTVVDSVPDAGAAWIVDPIDGTSNFVRGVRTWATSIAAVVDGETAAATTFMPAQEDVFAAGPESVSRNDEPMTVSARTDPETFAVSVVGWWPQSDRDAFGRVCGTLAGHLGDVRRIGSFQVTLANVADGGLEAAVSTVPAHSWDTIAGVHLVRRAGGMVTTLDGERWTPADETLIASNGAAHDAVLDAARAATED